MNALADQTPPDTQDAAIRTLLESTAAALTAKNSAIEELRAQFLEAERQAKVEARNTEIAQSDLLVAQAFKSLQDPAVVAESRLPLFDRAQELLGQDNEPVILLGKALGTTDPYKRIELLQEALGNLQNLRERPEESGAKISPREVECAANIGLAVAHWDLAKTGPNDGEASTLREDAVTYLQAAMGQGLDERPIGKDSPLAVFLPQSSQLRRNIVLASKPTEVSLRQVSDDLARLQATRGVKGWARKYAVGRLVFGA